MPKRRNIETDAIEANLRDDAINGHFMEIQTRRLEQEIGWFVASPGILVGDIPLTFDRIYQSDEYFRTGSKLVGSKRTLNGNTTVVAQSLRLPIDSSAEAVKAFIRDDALNRSFGYVSLNEPGFPLLTPIKSETSGFIETELTGKSLAAEAIGRYLNTTESFDDPALTPEIEGRINKTYIAIDASKPSYEEFLKMMKEGERRLRQQEAYDEAHPEEAAARKVILQAEIDAAHTKWLPLL